MRISFFHPLGAECASQRLRCAIPAKELGATINDLSADVYILTKHADDAVEFMHQAKARGKAFIFDVCDPHFYNPIYQELIKGADLLTASTPFTANLIREEFHRDCHVVPDAYEFEERPPHVSGGKLVWFGHGSNFYSIERYLGDLKDEDLTIITHDSVKEAGFKNTITWSLDTLKFGLQAADIVLLPETAPYKSPNRAVEAVRSGCFVVAQPHPGLEGFPGIWIGNLLKGIEWSKSNPSACNQRLIQSQAFVRENFSPGRVANAWRTIIQGLKSSSVADINHGQGGQILTAKELALLRTSSPTFALSH